MFYHLCQSNISQSLMMAAMSDASNINSEAGPGDVRRVLPEKQVSVCRAPDWVPALPDHGGPRGVGAGNEQDGPGAPIGQRGSSSDGGRLLRARGGGTLFAGGGPHSASRAEARGMAVAPPGPAASPSAPPGRAALTAVTGSPAAGCGPALSQRSLHAAKARWGRSRWRGVAMASQDPDLCAQAGASCSACRAAAMQPTGAMPEPQAVRGGWG